jgi:DNA-binding SARP family transcriptional activator
VIPAATGKVIPPSLPESYLHRPGLREHLDGVLRRRLTCVVAGAGFGKSTLLVAWEPGVRLAWYTLGPEDSALRTFGRGVISALRIRLPGMSNEVASVVAGVHGPHGDEHALAETLAGLLSQELHSHITSPVVLVLDDVQEISPNSASARLIEGLCRQAPEGFHLVIASRQEAPFGIDRLRGRGQVLEIGAAALSFSEEETTALLGSVLGSEAVPLGARLHAMTGGWPAGLRLAVEVLRSAPESDRERLLDGLPRPGGPLFAYLAREVFAQEPPAVGKLIRTVAPLRRFNAELCYELGIEGADEILWDLERRGVFVVAEGGLDNWFALTGLAREFALQHIDFSSGERIEINRRAALWFEKNGHLGEALACLEAGGDSAGIAALLRERGANAVSSGIVEGVISASSLVPPDLRDGRIDQVVGEALLIRGDWTEALECFQRAAGDDTLDVALAWRIALIHLHRGDFAKAVDTFEHARLAGSNRRDEAILLGWKATALWYKGDADACKATALEALDAAVASRAPEALAAAHTVLCMHAAFAGDRRANETHYFHALNAAERAGDVLQMIRIGANRAAHYNEEALFKEALAEVERVMPLAESAGYATFLGLCLNNRGDSMLGLGRLEEAMADYEAAKIVYQRIGSSDICYPFCGLGDVYRERGDLAVAQAAYEEALEVADAIGDAQGVIPALAGLARVIATDEPDRARSFAERAVSFGPNMSWVKALLAQGWVAMSDGDLKVAAQTASEAASAARERRDRAGLAESLELEAMAADDPASRATSLHQAIGLWREIGNSLAEATATLALAAIASEAVPEVDVEAARRRLRDLGVRPLTAGAGILAHIPSEDATPPVRVLCLGGLRLLREGKPVPVVEWQSKKARDLLKILVARRGRMCPREVLMDMLWPDDDPAKLGNRLSVALTTVRTILDPDKRFRVEHFIVTDKTAVGLDLTNLSIDVEEFLATAERGFALRRAGRSEDGLALLAEAEEAYGGDFLEEDPYEDWSVALREEARATYISVVRTLAHAASESGDHDAAARYYLRLLERDPFDEDAHLGIVSTLNDAGRYGESRRNYRSYVTRMDELGVEAAPFPGAAAPTLAN